MLSVICRRQHGIDTRTVPKHLFTQALPKSVYTYTQHARTKALFLRLMTRKKYAMGSAAANPTATLTAITITMFLVLLSSFALPDAAF